MTSVSDFYIAAGQIFLEDRIATDRYVRIRDGIIAGFSQHPERNIPVLEFPDKKLVPGFIDLHIHGRDGCDVMDAKQSSLETISHSLAKYGVTGFLATTVTTTWEKTLAAFSAIGKASEGKMPGAQLLGAYNEGLFFCHKHKGAHDDDYFLPLTRERIDQIIVASRGTLRVLAMAPEVNPSDDIIPYLVSRGVRVMLGHTNANYDQTCAALDAGACGGVHVFNGMSGIHHRDPGCAGAVLLNDSAIVEVIADGVHLHPAILQLIYRVKDKRKIALISDCINAGGLKDGRYKLGELDVEVNEGVARTETGSLAGSTLTLNKAVCNLTRLAGIAPLDAVHMASLVPAHFLGLQQSLGSIAVGKRANLVLLDEAGDVAVTFMDGRPVFNRNENLSAIGE